MTEKQVKYIALYYRDDYSLGEIAENFDVSRQAVYDNIRRTEKILEGYEDKLHLYQDFIKTIKDIDALKQYVNSKYSQDLHLMELIDNLDKIEE